MSLFDSGVRPIIDNWLLAKSREARDYQDYWPASSAGYCMRRLIFERLGVPKIEQNDEGRKQRVFTAGHIFHEWIQGITKEAGLSIAQELELQDEELMIRGHIDDLVLIKGELNAPNPTNINQTPIIKRLDHLILYDYKSVNSRAFMWAKKNDNKMSHYHRMQVATYVYMLRKELGKSGEQLGNGEGKVALTSVQGQTLTEARILKIEKENLMLMEQQLLWSPELEKDVVGYWKTLNGYWKAQKIPACTCDKFEGGFLSKPAYNPYYWNNEPCSLSWYEKNKKEGLLK